MAKADLDILASKIDKIIEEKKNSYREILNKEVHIYTINGNILFKQVSSQLKKIKKYSRLKSADFDKKLAEICETAAPEILKALTQYTGGRATVVLQKGSTDTVLVKSVTGKDTDVFTFIRTTRKPRLDKYLRTPIIKELFGNYTGSKKYSEFMEQPDEVLLGESSKPSSAYSKRINDLDNTLFGSYTKQKDSESLVRKNNRATRSGGFTHLGHLKENAVSKRLQGLAVDSLLNDNDVIKAVFPNNDIVIDVIRNFKSTLGGFSVEVKIIEESAYANLRDSVKEKKELQKLSKDLTDTLLKEIDWPDQKASSSSKEILTAIVINSAIDKIKAGVKRSPKKIKIDNKGSKTTKKSSNKTPSRSRAIKGQGKAPIDMQIDTRSRSTSRASTVNWLSIIPIINSRLIPKVLANMKAPALVNRTGTFAQSVKITNIEQTREGYPSFVFDYERDPYDVFDRIKGRAPWNTPQRDPRALVDKSVREVVREMAINRFYTRRA